MKKLIFFIILLLPMKLLADNYSKENIFKLILDGKFEDKIINSKLPKCSAALPDNERKNCWAENQNEQGRLTMSEYGKIPGKRHGLGVTKTKSVYMQGVLENDKYIYGVLKNFDKKTIFQGSFNQKGNFDGKGLFSFFNENGEIYLEYHGNWVDHLLEGPVKICTIDTSSKKETCKKVNAKGGKIVK